MPRALWWFQGGEGAFRTGEAPLYYELATAASVLRSILDTRRCQVLRARQFSGQDLTRVGPSACVLSLAISNPAEHRPAGSPNHPFARLMQPPHSTRASVLNIPGHARDWGGGLLGACLHLHALLQTRP